VPLLPVPYRYGAAMDAEHARELTTFHDDYQRILDELDKAHQARLTQSYQTYFGITPTSASIPPTPSAPATATDPSTPATATISTNAALRQALLALQNSDRELETARRRADETEAALERAVTATERYAKAATAAQSTAWGQGLYIATGLLDT